MKYIAVLCQNSICLYLKQQFCHLCFVEHDLLTIVAVNTQRAQWMSAESRESQIRFPPWILSNSAGHEQFCAWVRRKLCSHWQHKSNLCCMLNSKPIIYTLNSRKTHGIWFDRACRAILYWFLRHSSSSISSVHLAWIVQSPIFFYTGWVSVISKFTSYLKK